MIVTRSVSAGRSTSLTAVSGSPSTPHELQAITGPMTHTRRHFTFNGRAILRTCRHEVHCWKAFGRATVSPFINISLGRSSFQKLAFRFPALHSHLHVWPLVACISFYVEICVSAAMHGMRNLLFGDCSLCIAWVSGTTPSHITSYLCFASLSRVWRSLYFYTDCDFLSTSSMARTRCVLDLSSSLLSCPSCPPHRLHLSLG